MLIFKITVNFQNQFDFSQHVKAKCNLNMYLSYALQQWPKVIKENKNKIKAIQIKATDYHTQVFVTRAIAF